MKKSLIVFLLAVIFGCEARQEQKESESLITAEDESQLRYLKEVEWPKAYREQDTALLDRILGEDFQMIDASGEWSNKKFELDWIKKNPVGYDSFFFEIKRLDVLPNGTALICGTGHIINDTTETIYQSSNILIKREGGWKAVASHVSGINERN